MRRDVIQAIADPTCPAIPIHQLLRNFRNGYFKSIRDPKKYRQIKFFFPLIGLVILVSLPAHQATSALHKD